MMTWENLGKALTTAAFAGVGLAALAGEQLCKAGKVLAEKGEIYVAQGKKYGEELQQKLQTVRSSSRSSRRTPGAARTSGLTSRCPPWMPSSGTPCAAAWPSWTSWSGRPGRPPPRRMRPRRAPRSPRSTAAPRIVGIRSKPRAKNSPPGRVMRPGGLVYCV